MTFNNYQIKELFLASKILARANLAVLILLLILEKNFSFLGTGTSLGFILGSLLMIFNLQVLGRGWQPIIMTMQGSGLAVLSTLFSFFILSLSSFLIFYFAKHLLLGFVLSFACLPLGGFFYACRVKDEEQNEEELKSLG